MYMMHVALLYVGIISWTLLKLGKYPYFENREDNCKCLFIVNAFNIFVFKGCILEFCYFTNVYRFKIQGRGGLSPNIPLYAGFAVNMISGKNLAVNV